MYWADSTSTDVTYISDCCTDSTVTIYTQDFSVTRGSEVCNSNNLSFRYKPEFDGFQKALTQRQHLLTLLALLEQPTPVFKFNSNRLTIGVREREQAYLRRLHQRL